MLLNEFVTKATTLCFRFIEERSEITQIQHCATNLFGISNVINANAFVYYKIFCDCYCRQAGANTVISVGIVAQMCVTTVNRPFNVFFCFFL